MKARLVRVAKWAAFPAFYLFCLLVFGYLTFPFDRLRDRVVAEIETRGKSRIHLEIGRLGPYFLSGLEVANLKLYLPSTEPAHPSDSTGAAKDSMIQLEQAHARVRILPLILGRTEIDFWAAGLGGEVTGTLPIGESSGDLRLDVDHIELGKVEPLAQMLAGVPVRGSVTAKLELAAPGGKLTKANGNLELTIADASVSDGKTKIAGLLELPTAKLGEVTLSAEAKDGVLKLRKLSGAGADVEVAGDGKVTLRESWGDSVADLFLRFRFSDAYREKNTTTKSLLGEPGSSVPGLIEMQVPKMKTAKRPDGFYGWHATGPLKRLKFEPTATDMPGSSPTPTKRPTAPQRKPPHVPAAPPDRAARPETPAHEPPAAQVAPPNPGPSVTASAAPTAPPPPPPPPEPPPPPAPSEPAADTAPAPVEPPAPAQPQ